MNELSATSIRAHLLVEFAREAPGSRTEAVVRKNAIKRLRLALAAAEAHRNAVAAWTARGRPMLPAAAPWGTR